MEFESNYSTELLGKEYETLGDLVINQGNHTCWWKI